MKRTPPKQDADRPLPGPFQLGQPAAAAGEGVCALAGEGGGRTRATATIAELPADGDLAAAFAYARTRMLITGCSAPSVGTVMVLAGVAVIAAAAGHRPAAEALRLARAFLVRNFPQS